MTSHLNRRAALGLGAAAAAGIALGSTAVAAAEEPPNAGAEPEPAPTTALAACDPIKEAYQREVTKAAGTWNSFITVADPAGALVTAVEDKPDEVVQAYSVNKIAVATAVLHKIDQGQLTLDQRVDVTADLIVKDGDGIFRLDRAYPSSVTLGHVMANLLSISDDTSVRLCGLVCPAKELNEILVAKGFPKTQVTPVANPNRFFLGKTTSRETHDLLQALVKGTLLSAQSTDFILNVLRSPAAFMDGIRRSMSSDERGRIATKAGWFADGRNEAGIIFDKAGKPVLTYSTFARGQAQPNDFGATHPAVQARAVMGREFLDAIERLPGVTALRRSLPKYQPSNGG